MSLETYIPERDNEKISLLKTLIETEPNGVAIIDIHKQFRIGYSTIRKYAERWGFKIVKKRVKRFTIVDVIIKEGEKNGT